MTQDLAVLDLSVLSASVSDNHPFFTASRLCVRFHRRESADTQSSGENTDFAEATTYNTSVFSTTADNVSRYGVYQRLTARDDGQVIGEF